MGHAYTQNEIQFQYPDGEPYAMTLYRVKGIERRDQKIGNGIAYDVKLVEEPRNSGNERTFQLPDIFFLDVFKAFQNDDFLLASNNNGIVDSVLIIERPVRFSVADYLKNLGS